jgi:hypothetical protein
VELPVRPPVDPMLAKLTRELPRGDLLYEPKWDGFRCLVFRDGDELFLQSRNGKPLDRYFPELQRPLRELLPSRCVLDGELVVPRDGQLDFDALSERIHPADSRVVQLAAATPARFVAFDLLALDDDDLTGRAFVDRRAALEEALEEVEPPVHLSPATRDAATAADWFERFEGAGLDGVIAKPLAEPYAAGKRTLLKIKHQRTADVVVGGSAGTRTVPASARCCSGSTTTRAGCGTSASPRRSARSGAPSSSTSSRHTGRPRTSRSSTRGSRVRERRRAPAHRHGGTAARTPAGNRCGSGSSPRSPTSSSPATGCGTAPGSYGGAPTASRRPAATTSSTNRPRPSWRSSSGCAERPSPRPAGSTVEGRRPGGRSPALDPSGGSVRRRWAELSWRGG